jgi:hypothetical protein
MAAMGTLAAKTEAVKSEAVKTAAVKTEVVKRSPAEKRRDLELLSQQRERAASRLVAERARNARFAIMSAGVFAVVLGVGVKAVWTPADAMRTQPPPEIDAKTREFMATRAGNVVLPTRDEEICREIKFHNDTGKFSGGRAVRCDEAIPVVPQTSSSTNDPNVRATSVREYFNKR